ncbi:MAG: response regulator [Gallionella sp.]|nr:response regulator [Gallionella sp.]MDD4947030.1 response regulator [Gallionella sp.]MDD5612613.1 response regulator [Gallionella sp.]
MSAQHHQTGSSPEAAECAALSLLIVEDDQSLASYLAEVMKAEGYQVVCAHSRHEALSIRPQPLLALVDLGLPPAENRITEGMFLLDALLAHDPHSKIIVITGQDEEAAAFEAVRRGAFDFLCKPAAMSDIKAAVKRAGLFLHHEEHLSETGEARLHLTVKLANGPKDTACAVEEQVVRSAVADAHGNVTEAARRLGLGREHLYYYLKKYGIQPDRA